MKKVLANWGNYPKITGDEFSFQFEQEIKALVESKEGIIARGNGRCYGDASLGDHVMSTLKYDKIIEFDTATGLLHCQAGVTLSEILDIITPRGWFLPVTPGTKYITVGGALASDVHGKNHHVEGSFSNHVLSFDLLTAEGNRIEVSPEAEPELFGATAGGMGLTGIILSVRFRLKAIESCYIQQKQIKARNLDEIFALFEAYQDYTYSMSWIDCFKSGKDLGRSILIVGEHAIPEALSPKIKSPLELPKKGQMSMPFNLPSFVLNKLSIKAFNFLYYQKNYKKEMDAIVPYDAFFYPLDAILQWNRMYGKAGFLQYQFVLPMETSKSGLTEILNRINKKGLGSFLAVLKQFGEQESLISFPMKGFTLALDFPIRKGLLPFLDELDKVVLDMGGRLYLSKDSRMHSDMFWKTYDNAEKFRSIIQKYNPEYKFQSTQSKRLTIT